EISEALRANGNSGLAALADMRLQDLNRFVLDGAWRVMEQVMDKTIVQAVRSATEDEDDEVRDSGIETLIEGMGDNRLSAALVLYLSNWNDEHLPLIVADNAALLKTIDFRDTWLNQLTAEALNKKEDPMDNNRRQLLGLLDKIVFLKQVPFFSKLTLDELGRVADIAEEQFHEQETPMFLQGASNQILGVIIEGCLSISTVDSNGEERLISKLHPKYVYGESSSIYGTLTTAKGTAHGGELHILAIQGAEFAKLIRLYPGIGIGILQSAFDRVRRLEESIVKDLH
ncbi:MAG TPA: cyclic nucleotide-binding domain-containing protein, partial [Bacilli bacterium]